MSSNSYCSFVYISGLAAAGAAAVNTAIIKHKSPCGQLASAVTGDKLA